MKKLWKNNRVLFMLIVILFLCFIAIVVVALTFFYSKNVTNYGARLEGIDNYKITKDFQKEYQDKLKENESVKNIEFNIEGRIIYIHIDFDEKITLDDAKNLSTNSLTLFEESIRTYYDIEFVLKSDNFTIIGAKNAVVDHISWNNNTEIKEDTEDEKS